MFVCTHTDKILDAFFKGIKKKKETLEKTVIAQTTWLIMPPGAYQFLWLHILIKHYFLDVLQSIWPRRTNQRTSPSWTQWWIQETVIWKVHSILFLITILYRYIYKLAAAIISFEPYKVITQVLGENQRLQTESYLSQKYWSNISHPILT